VTTLFDRIQGSRHAGKDLAPNALDSDCRGRVAVADSNHVIFFSGLSMINSRCDESINDVPTLKTSAISTIPIVFVVRGLKFVPDFENSIYVWGFAKAKVVTMTNNLTMIAAEMDLVINSNLDHGPREILNCRWIVGSGSCIAVGCTHHVLIFDVSQTGCSIQPILIVSSLADGSALLDLMVVRVSSKTNTSEREWKIFASLENRKIRTTTVLQDRNGLMSEIDPIDCLNALAKEGNDLGADSIDSGSVTSRYLYYFEQSNVLIYENDQSNVGVLFLTENGAICRFASLLPFSFLATSSVSGGSITVHGPFTCWNEIKSIRRGSEDFVRAVCVGRLENSNADVLISLEFDHNLNVNVQVLGEPSLHDDIKRTYMGLVTFTAPMLKTESIASTFHHERRFTEQIVICALTGAGSFTTYVDRVGSLSLPNRTPSCYENADDSQYHTVNEIATGCLKDMEQTLSMVATEDFKNITDSDEVVFGGADLGT
jgi:hypothetical protein